MDAGILAGRDCIYHHDGNHTNFSVLRHHVIRYLLDNFKFGKLELTKELKLKNYEGTGIIRSIYCARN